MHDALRERDQLRNGDEAIVLAFERVDYHLRRLDVLAAIANMRI
jgi:hypothetical protein